MAANSVIFFGTGPVALASLSALAKHFSFEAVVTKPDHVAHNGAVIEQSLKLWAESAGVSCFQPANAAELSKLFASQQFASRLGLVVDYGIIIPAAVIDGFELGIVNSHFSLLPKLRGPDPITAAILSGQPKTGVSLMLIASELDTGKLLVQRTLDISPNDTSVSLTDKLIVLSNKLLIEYLPKYLAGQLKPRAQPHPNRATYTKKLSKSDGTVDWRKPANQIEAEIRAFLGWPGSRTQLAGRDVTITAARVSSHEGEPGKHFINNGQLGVYTGGGSLIIDKIKPAGRNEMSGAEFIRGYLSR